MTTRIKGDGNCFFRAISQVLTGSQEDHQEFRTLATSYLLENATSNKMLSALDPWHYDNNDAIFEEDKNVQF